MENLVWEEIRGKLRSHLAPHIYHSLVAPTNCKESEDGSLELDFENEFIKEAFEEKCLPAIQGILKDLKKEQVRLALHVLQGEASALDSSISFTKRNPFDDKYTFSTFVTGTSNQFAHAACQAVSRQPGQSYNPLFIFGGAGLGKTHLLRAIGHELYKTQPNLRILFLTSEAFTNELIQAIRNEKMREFRDKYRTGCDVLLLDDVHFLAGKERTQEEFFYTFNYLHELRKQIVITSDRYPKDIQGLENRLQTRFEWGLVADVQPPEIETRIAILQNKADKEGILLPDDVASYIASYVTSNIRELEGSLHRVQAYAALTGVTISLDLAKQILKEIAPKAKHEVTTEGILKMVALEFGVKGSDLKADKRTRNLTMPRHICWYLLRKQRSLSYPQIAEYFGGKDHTTVMHGVNRITALLKNDPEILRHMTNIEGLLR